MNESDNSATLTLGSVEYASCLYARLLAAGTEDEAMIEKSQGSSLCVQQERGKDVLLRSLFFSATQVLFLPQVGV